MASATALVVPTLGAPFQTQQVELDSLRPHEVLVDLVATGVCHTDIKVQHGLVPLQFPAVLGHEGSGVVRHVGSEVQHVAPGDHVVLSYNSCGSCSSCASQRAYHCDSTFGYNFGCKRPDGSQTIRLDDGAMSTCFFGQSSFCNPAVVQEASCVKVDKDLPLQVVCAMGCGFQTGAGSIYNVVKPLERKIRYLAIFGIGGVGGAAIMAAQHLLKTHTDLSYSIIAVDINDSRLQLAQELGATHVINPRGEKSTRESVNAMTQNAGLDAVVDCSGDIRVIEEMIDLLGPGGIAVTVGAPDPGTKVAVDVFSLLQRCKTYCGTHQGNSDSRQFIPWLAEIYADGYFPLEKMQKTYSAQDINSACEDMLKGKVVKPILLWTK